LLRRNGQHDFLAGGIADVQLDFATAHDVERLAGIAGIEQGRAGIEAAQVDDLGQADTVFVTEVFEQFHSSQHLGVTGHRASPAVLARVYAFVASHWQASDLSAGPGCVTLARYAFGDAMSNSPLIDRRHLDFMLYELLGVESLCQQQRFAEHGRETFDAVIDLAHRVALEKFLPHNRKSDLNEPHIVDGRVVMIPEIGEALAAFNDAGFTAVMADSERGGLQMPFLMATVGDAIFAAANLGTSAYPALARAAANLLDAHASEDQKRLYMQPILEGRFFGTMCLSEPQAGSSLADITTLATPQEDGSYKITGAKMWISAGEHEHGENIVHLVLARIVGAPPGVRGISLFIVPRYRVNDDGSVGAANDVRLAGLEPQDGPARQRQYLSEIRRR
jgi:hypothetical protein